MLGAWHPSPFSDTSPPFQDTCFSWPACASQQHTLAPFTCLQRLLVWPLVVASGYVLLFCHGRWASLCLKLS